MLGQLRLTSRLRAPNDLYNHKATRQRTTICGGHGVYMFIASLTSELLQHPFSLAKVKFYVLWFKSQFLVEVPVLLASSLFFLAFLITYFGRFDSV